MAWKLTLVLIILPVLAGGVWSYSQGWAQNWHSADWSSSGVGLKATKAPEAVIRVYSARTGRWKGIFAVHTWITVKRAGARRFDRYDVVGWGNPVRLNNYPADGFWYSNLPRVILDVRGPRAERLIPQIEAAIDRYPYTGYGSYRVWPGPNSNTFVAWIARQVPELDLELPPTAIGKDYLGDGFATAPTPSGSGKQFSWKGLIGAGIARREGLEIHILGATIGLDPEDLAVKLPSIGSLGFGRFFAEGRANPVE